MGDFDVENIYTSVNEKQSKFTPPERIVEKEKHLIESDIQKLDSLQMEIFISKLAIGFKSVPFTDNHMRENILVQLLFNLLFGWTSPYYQNWYAEGK